MKNLFCFLLVHAFCSSCSKGNEETPDPASNPVTPSSIVTVVNHTEINGFTFTSGISYTTTLSGSLSKKILSVANNKIIADIPAKSVNTSVLTYKLFKLFKRRFYNPHLSMFRQAQHDKCCQPCHSELVEECRRHFIIETDKIPA